MSKELELESENLNKEILLRDSARWPATPAHPYTALTQRTVRSACI